MSNFPFITLAHDTPHVGIVHAVRADQDALRTQHILVLWDEDRDARVLLLLSRLVAHCLAYRIVAIHEHKGTVTLWLRDDAFNHTLESWIDDVRLFCVDIEGDDWELFEPRTPEQLPGLTLLARKETDAWTTGAVEAARREGRAS